MTRAGLLVLLAVAGGACNGAGPWGIPVAGQGYEGPDSKLPNQSAAEAVIFKALGYPTPSSPIVWRYDTTCTDGSGTYTNSFDDGFHTCVDGEYYPQLDYVQTMWHGTTFSNTSLAHELCHAYLQYTTGDADAGHNSYCFSTLMEHYTNAGVEAPGSLVVSINQALRGENL